MESIINPSKTINGIDSIPSKMTGTIHPIKSCKGRIEYGEFEYTPTELIRNIRYSPEIKEEVQNIYYREFFNNLKIINGGYIYNEHCKDEQYKTYYIVCRTDLDNIVKMKDGKTVIEKTSYYSCKANNKEEEKIKIEQNKYPKWFLNLDNEEKGFRELLPSELLQRTFTDYFTKTTYNYKILPNIAAYHEIFDQKKVNDFLILLLNRKNVSSNIIYEFLSTIKFAYFIKNWEKKSIFDLDKGDISFLEDIKKKIYEFISKFFINGTIRDFNPHNCFITLTADKGNEYFFVNFILYDRMKITKYSSYVETYKNINIDDAIYNLQKNVPLSYFFNSTENIRNIKCKQLTPISEKIIHINSVSSGVQDLNILLKKIIDKADSIKLISSSEPLDKYHSYCSLTIIIMVEDKYYKVSIKSITFDKLKHDKSFYEEYFDILKNGTYKYIGNSYIGLLKLPACVRITINEIKKAKLKISYSYNMMETSHSYKTQVFENIRRTDINPALILRYICVRMIHDNNSKLEKLCMTIPSFAFAILGCMGQSPNFIICPKINILAYLFYYYNFRDNVSVADFKAVFNEIMCTDDSLIKVNIDEKIKAIKISDNNKISYNEFIKIMEILIKDTTKVFQIWFVHKDLGMETNKLNTILNEIKNAMYTREFRNFNEENILKTLLMDLPIDINFIRLNEFYNLFTNKDSDFVYNIRHLQPYHIKEILDLISVGKLENRIPVIHYPNDDAVNVFHMQLYPKDYSSEDLAGLQSDVSISRSYILNKYEDISFNYFMDMDIMLTLKINAEPGLNREDLKKSSAYKKHANKYTARPEFLPLE